MTTRRYVRIGRVVLGLLLLQASEAAAEWQFKPFVGVTYGGDSTFLFVGPLTTPPFPNHPHFNYGISALLIGEVFGVEADFGHTPGFFQSSNTQPPSIIDSGVRTLTGNVVVAMPRWLTQYTLRPYIVGGAGVMHLEYDTDANVLHVAETLSAMDVGAGVTGFLTKRIGVSWDVRYFRSIDRSIEKGFSFGPERLSFWRANMAVAIKL
jgi:opacity protein-like surface antigen